MKNFISSILVIVLLLVVGNSVNSTTNITVIKNIQQVATICENSQEDLNKAVSDMFAQGWETESSSYYNGSTGQWCQQLHD